MNLRYLAYCIFLSAMINGCNAKQTSAKEEIVVKPKYAAIERLNHPFGTLLKLKVEIIDGESLNDKIHQSDFLFKIKSVDSIPVAKETIMEFKDETGKFPNGEFELYKYLYGKDTGTISSDESDKIKKKYVGHEFNIVAYETGEFRGIPDGYFNYQPIVQGAGFHFNNYLIVIADLTRAN